MSQNKCLSDVKRLTLTDIIVGEVSWVDVDGCVIY